MAVIYGIASNDAGTYVAVGATGTVLVSTDSAISWWEPPVPIGVTEDLFSVAFGEIPDGAGGFTFRFVAVGANGTILQSDANSVSIWTEISSGTVEDLHGIAFSAGSFLVVGDTGTFLSSQDMGTTWELESSGTTEDLFDIFGESDVYTIVGDNETVIVGSISSIALDASIVEFVSTAGNSSSVGIFSGATSTVTTGLEALDSTGDTWYAFVTENMFSFASLDYLGAYNASIAEFVLNILGQDDNVSVHNFLLDTVDMTDSSDRLYSLLVTLTETATFGEFLATDIAVQILERMGLSVDLSSAGSSYNHTQTETLGLTDVIAITWVALLTEQITLSGTATDKFETVAIIAERLTAAGVVATRLDAVGIVSVALAIVETLASGKGGDVTELVDLTDAVVDLATLLATGAESLIMSDIASQTGVITIPITEVTTLADTITLQQLLSNLITENISFSLTFGQDDVVYTGWVMNTKNFATSQYSTLPFNSFAKIGDTYYGANQNGLYALGGDTDAGVNIDTELTLGIMDFTKDRKTTVPECFLSLRTDGSILLKTITDDNIERWYEMTETADVLKDRREKLARGVKSRYWTFSLTNIDGSDFELRNFDPVPIVLKRR